MQCSIPSKNKECETHTFSSATVSHIKIIILHSSFACILMFMNKFTFTEQIYNLLCSIYIEIEISSTNFGTQIFKKFYRLMRSENKEIKNT